jgi:hypothetical protein
VTVLESSRRPGDAADDLDLLGRALIGLVFGLTDLIIIIAGSEFGSCSIRLATRPIPSQMAEMPGGTGTRGLVLMEMRSPHLF